MLDAVSTDTANPYDSAQSFEELSSMFLSHLAASGRNLTMISGPITTGGFNDRILNLELFDETIRIHQSLGYRVINVMPLENAIDRLRREWHSKDTSSKNDCSSRLSGKWRERYAASPKSYCWPILTIVYWNIIHSGFVSGMFIIPCEEPSLGSDWEVEEFSLISRRLSKLPDRWHDPVVRTRYKAEMHELLAA